MRLHLPPSQQLNLFGLQRDQVSERTWRLGRIVQWVLLLWLAAGLLIMLPINLWPAIAPALVPALTGWFASLPLLIVPGLAFHLCLLRDGWRQRGSIWRAGAAAMVLASLGMAAAWTALVLWYVARTTA